MIKISHNRSQEAGEWADSDLAKRGSPDLLLQAATSWDMLEERKVVLSTLGPRPNVCQLPPSLMRVMASNFFMFLLLSSSSAPGGETQLRRAIPTRNPVSYPTSTGSQTVGSPYSLISSWCSGPLGEPFSGSFLSARSSFSCYLWNEMSPCHLSYGPFTPRVPLLSSWVIVSQYDLFSGPLPHLNGKQSLTYFAINLEVPSS